MLTPTAEDIRLACYSAEQQARRRVNIPGATEAFLSEQITAVATTPRPDPRFRGWWIVGTIVNQVDETERDVLFEPTSHRIRVDAPPERFMHTKPRMFPFLGLNGASPRYRYWFRDAEITPDEAANRVNGNGAQHVTWTLRTPNGEL